MEVLADFCLGRILEELFLERMAKVVFILMVNMSTEEELFLLVNSLKADKPETKEEWDLTKLVEVMEEEYILLDREDTQVLRVSYIVKYRIVPLMNYVMLPGVAHPLGVGVPNVNGIGTNAGVNPTGVPQGVIGGPGANGYPGGAYYPGQAIGQYPNGIMYPGTAGAPGSTGVGPANLVEEEDDSFAQSETAVKNGEATASAQGKRHGGNAQTQVSGSYSSGGTFSANAQTSDKERSAQAQVTGNKDGALSSAQGTGGTAKSQSQVQVNEKTGATSATSQSGGSSHESQSEVSCD